MKNLDEKRPLEDRDIEPIAVAFRALGWDEPRRQYERYPTERRRDHRVLFGAFIEDPFAGYPTINRSAVSACSVEASGPAWWVRQSEQLRRVRADDGPVLYPTNEPTGAALQKQRKARTRQDPPADKTRHGPKPQSLGQRHPLPRGFNLATG